MAFLLALDQEQMSHDPCVKNYGNYLVASLTIVDTAVDNSLVRNCTSGSGKAVPSNSQLDHLQGQISCHELGHMV